MERLLIYGCNVAAGDTGAELIAKLKQLTGAEIAASTTRTGNIAQGGNWELEYQTGTIAFTNNAGGSIPTADATALLRDITYRNDATTITSNPRTINVTGIDTNSDSGTVTSTIYAVNSGNGTPLGGGNGAIYSTHGNNIIYSVDVTTGKATELTTSPFASTINSLASDVSTGLVYYVDDSTDNRVSTNVALYAYDAFSNVHFVVDDDLTDNGVVVSNSGLSRAAASFDNGFLYLGVEGGTGSGTAVEDRVYRINFTAGSNGRVVDTATKVLDLGTDWGDFVVVGNTLYDISGSTGTNQIREYDLTTGTLVDADSFSGLSQAAKGRNGTVYNVSSSISSFNPTTDNLGTAIPITTNGTTSVGGALDSAEPVQASGSIGNLVWNDSDGSGTQEAGEIGISGVTIDIYNDVDGDGNIDVGVDSLLGSDTTDSNGAYRFDNLLPGDYIVRVTDTGGVLTGGTYTTTGGNTQTVSLDQVGTSNTGIDFGYQLPFVAPTLDLDDNNDSGAADPNNQTNFIPGGSEVAITTDSIIIDGDDTNLESATVTLTNFKTGDVLLVNGVDATTGGTFTGTSGNPINFSATNTGTEIIITFTSATADTVPLADYQELLAAITFDNTEPTPDPSDRIIEVVVNDGDINSNIATTTITVNNPPVVDLDNDTTGDNDAAYSNTFTEGDATPAGITDGFGTITDDDTSFVNLKVAIAGMSDGADEVFSINGTEIPLDGSNTPATVTVGGNVYDVDLTAGVLTFTANGGGEILKADAEALLNAINYENKSDSPTESDRTFNVTVNDGDVDSVAATSTITVVAANDLPIINLDPTNTTGGADDGNFETFFVLSGTPVNIAEATTATGSDPDGTDIESLTLTMGGITTDAADEVLTIGGTNFALNADASVTNLTITGATATFDVEVTNNGTTFTITRNGGGDISQADIEALLREITYDNNATTPTLGDRTIDFTLNDGTVDSNTVTSTITVTDNTPPSAGDDTYTVPADTSFTAILGSNDLLQNDSDPDGDTLSVDTTPVTPPTNGTAVLNPDGTFTYTPNNGFTGSDSFQYSISDGKGGTATATANITVTSGLQPPTIDLDGNDSAPTQNITEDFESVTYSNGTDGSPGTWSTNWSETGETTSPTGGNIRISSDGDRALDFRALETGSNTSSITRTANLSDFESAILTFDFRRLSLFNNATVAIEISTDGTDFTQIGTIDGTTSDSTYQTFSQDISGFISSTTSIRFSANIPGNGDRNSTALFIDDIDIALTAPEPTGFTNTFTTNGDPVAIAESTGLGTVTTDSDSTDLAGATITLTNPISGDSLLVGGTLPSGISATVNGSGDVITLSGIASLANYETAIEALRFDSTNSDLTTRNIDIQVTDETGLTSNIATSNITIELDTDGDGIADTNDIDDDNDGILDINEQTTSSFNSTTLVDTDTDGDGIFDRLDIDADDDGITDNVEAQTTAGYIAPSGTGAGITDADGDGLDDNYDAATANTDPTTSAGLTPIDTDSTLGDADSVPDYLDADSDNDGTLDINEAGHASTTLVSDTDGDGLNDVFEGADNNDGFDVNDENLDATDTNFNLADSDLDTAADGSDATPLTNDLDYRDNNLNPVAVADTNSATEGGSLISDNVLTNG